MRPSTGPRGPTLLLRILEPLSCPLVLDIADRQPQHLHRRRIRGEMASGLGDLAQLVVHRLNRIRRVNDLPQLGRELQKRGEPLPRVAPGGHRRWILPAQLGCLEIIQGFQKLVPLI